MQFESAEHLYWWLFVGTKGGRMREMIVKELMTSPANANQLAKRLGVNYRTVMHHLTLLEENGIVKSEGPRYGKVFFLSQMFYSSYSAFSKIVNGGKVSE